MLEIPAIHHLHRPQIPKNVTRQPNFATLGAPASRRHLPSANRKSSIRLVTPFAKLCYTWCYTLKVHFDQCPCGLLQRYTLFTPGKGVTSCRPVTSPGRQRLNLIFI